MSAAAGIQDNFWLHSFLPLLLRVKWLSFTVGDTKQKEKRKQQTTGTTTVSGGTKKHDDGEEQGGMQECRREAGNPTADCG
jgi:hypothetical protein